MHFSSFFRLVTGSSQINPLHFVTSPNSSAVPTYTKWLVSKEIVLLRRRMSETLSWLSRLSTWFPKLIKAVEKLKFRVVALRRSKDDRSFFWYFRYVWVCSDEGPMLETAVLYDGGIWPLQCDRRLNWRFAIRFNVEEVRVALYLDREIFSVLWCSSCRCIRGLAKALKSFRSYFLVNHVVTDRIFFLLFTFFIVLLLSALSES